MAKKILIVEDDEAIAQTEKEHLEKWNFLAQCASDFKEIVSEVADFTPDLILLDVKLPYYNGFYWCSEIRKFSKVPIIFVSSADDDMNIVMAMDMGGDDFIPKPVDLNVLTAKLQAVLRRAYDMGSKMAVIEHRGAMLNLNDASLVYNGCRIELTKNDFRILQTLLENKGKVVSRDTLMTKLWQIDAYVEENTLTVNVNRLRKKLENVGLHDFITTKIGCGYIIE